LIRFSIETSLTFSTENQMAIRMLTVGLLFGCMFALTGCGGGGMTVDGKVTNGGQPYVPSKDGAMSVGLTGEGAGKSFSSKVEDDGTFKIAGVPAGKYDVTATIYPTPESTAKAGKANNAGAGGAPLSSSSASTSKKLDEKWDVSSSNKSFTLDVSKLKDLPKPK